MKLPVQTFALLLAMAIAARAEDLTIDGTTYKEIRWGKATPSSVEVLHTTGIANIPLEKLPADLQQRFGYEPGKAVQFQQQQNEAQRQWRQKQGAAQNATTTTAAQEATIVGQGSASERYTLDEHLALVRAIPRTVQEPQVGDGLVHYTSPSKLSACLMQVIQVVPATSSAKTDYLLVSLLGHYEHRVVTNWVASWATSFYRSDSRPPRYPKITEKDELVEDGGSFSFALLVPDVKEYAEDDRITATIVRTGSLTFDDTRGATRTIARYLRTN